MSAEDHARVSAVFDMVASGYDNDALRLFPACANKLVSSARLRSGLRVLDVATGTGEVAALASQRILPDGRLAGVDISEGMLDQARQKMLRLGVKNVDFHIMDAIDLEFDRNNFDTILCSYGLFFISDMRAALSDWFRVLAPGGQLVFSCFGPKAFLPMTDIFFKTLEAYGVDVPESSLSTNRDYLSSVKNCKELVSGVGYTDCEVETVQLGYHLRNIEQWWDVIENAAYRGWVEAVDVDQRSAFKQSFLDAMSSLPEEQSLWFDVETHIVKGNAPT